VAPFLVWLLSLSFSGACTPSHLPPTNLTPTSATTIRCALTCAPVSRASLEETVEDARRTVYFPPCSRLVGQAAYFLFGRESRDYTTVFRPDLSTHTGSCAAWHFDGLDRLIQFRFDSVAVWPEAGEQDQRKHHGSAEARERNGIGMEAVVSGAHQEHTCRS
jgi:hypothetical protein